jgi:hypothetical protein
MSRNLEIIAIYRSERFRFENAESTVIIGSAQLAPQSRQTARNVGIEDSYITIKGEADDDELEKGVTYRFLGQWKDYFNRRSGGKEKQFCFSTFVQHVAPDRQSLIDYLTHAGKGNGVGARKAAILVDRFGIDEVLDKCRQPLEVVSAIGIKQDQAERFADYLIQQKAIESALLDLDSLLAGKGFPKTLPRKLIKEFGNQAAQIVTDDPFTLMQFKGVGFKKADNLWNLLRKPANDVHRLAMCLWYGMHSDTSGSTWFPARVSVEKLSREIGCEIDYRGAIMHGKELAETSEHHYGAIASTRTDADGYPQENGPVLWLSEHRNDQREQGIVDVIESAFDEAKDRVLTGEDEFHRVEIANYSVWPNVDSIQNVSDHQREQLRIAIGGENSPIAILTGSPGTGKAQPLDEPVLTPDGFVPMVSIVPGSMVIGEDGKPKKVKAVFPQGKKQVYRVSFSDGTWTRCCGEHLWRTTTRKERQRKNSLGSEKTTIEIMNSIDRGDGSPNHAIPMSLPVEYSGELDLPVDPYVLGVLLGDGCLVQGLGFSNPDADVLWEMSKRIPETVSITTSGGGCDFNISKNCSGRLNPLLQKVKQLGLFGKKSNQKFIPEQYLRCGSNQRIQLLQGLLDTDGYTDGHNIEYSTCSERLANNVQELVESFGGTVTVSQKFPTFTYRGIKKTGQLSYRMIIKLPPTVNPFKLRRKKEKYIPKSKYIPRRYITKIEKESICECQCISIDSATGLYLTRNFIVTHNTYAVAQLLKTILRQGRIGVTDIVVGAPTGKAAIRLTETFQQAGLPITARTWHSHLFGLDAEKGGSLPCRLMIGDETSMNDLELMHRVFSARPFGAHMLLVGDPFQLPPVDCGAPFRDLIDSGVIPSGHLTKIERNAGEIVEICARIRDGQRWDDLLNVGNVFCHQAKSPESQIEKLETLVRQHDKWEAQVLVPVNDKSPVCRKVLNDRLQKLLNTDGEPVKGTKFRIGDKIVCTQNGWYQVSGEISQQIDESDINERAEVRIANGELAEVVNLHPRGFIAKLESPRRHVIVTVGKDSGKDAATDGDDSQAESPTEEASKESSLGGLKWELGYALSCHKAQGSEFPYVYIMIDEYPGARTICDASWVMTAISRAKQECYLIGNPETAQRWCRSWKIGERKTFLKERLIAASVQRELEAI